VTGVEGTDADAPICALDPVAGVVLCSPLAIRVLSESRNSAARKIGIPVECWTVKVLAA
jgi:hypothetical protein